MMTLADDGASPGTALFETVLPVRWGDQDADGHVNNTVMLRFAEEARMQWASALNLAQEAPDRTPVVAAVGCTYHAPVHYPASVHVRVFCTRLGRTSLHLAFEIGVIEAGAAQRRCASACAVWVWVEKESRRPIPMPAALRSLCEAAS